jgi:NAD(P)-dependent dehydrogenase (short-subunit alcohol dehydrogenase family)
MKVQDKVVIVTGATSGIGRETAALLSTHQATVVLASWQLEELRRLERTMKGVLAVPTDLMLSADILRLVMKTREELGRIDAVVNCASRTVFEPVIKTVVEDYRNLLDLNVIAPLNVMQTVAPVMRAQGGGAIVNVGALATRAYAPGFGAYASTKEALNVLTMTARKELAKDNIKVSMVLAGLTSADLDHGVNETPAARVAATILKVLESGAAETEVAA